MLAPVKVRVPPLIFVNAPVFNVPEEMTPASERLTPFVSIVNVDPSAIEMGRFIETLAVESFNVEEPVTDIAADEEPSAPSALMLSVPWFNVVPPL